MNDLIPVSSTKESKAPTTQNETEDTEDHVHFKGREGI